MMLMHHLLLVAGFAFMRVPTKLLPFSMSIYLKGIVYHSVQAIVAMKQIA